MLRIRRLLGVVEEVEKILERWPVVFVRIEHVRDASDVVIRVAELFHHGQSLVYLVHYDVAVSEVIEVFETADRGDADHRDAYRPYVILLHVVFGIEGLGNEGFHELGTEGA